MPGLISRLVRAPQNTEIRTSAELEALLRRGSRGYAGIDVSASNVLTVSAAFAGVRLIAEDIAKLPFVVYRSGADGARERAFDSPYYRLIHDRPNPWQSSQQFRELLTTWALWLGDGFALKNIIRGNQVVELLPLHPSKVRVEQRDDFEVLYHVRFRPNESEETLTRREIFHLPGFSLDGVKGVNILVQLAKEGVSHALALERHGATFFGNGAHASGKYKHPGELSERAFERLKAELADLKGDGAHNALILEEGLDWIQDSIDNEASQFLESRKFTVSEFARWLRIPPHKLGDLERATFSNIEHQSIEYVSDTLMPWARRWEHATNGPIVPGESGLFAEILFDALLRGDTKSRYEAFGQSVGGPFMSRNEGRRAENLPPVPGGDEILVPLNMGTEADREAMRLKTKSEAAGQLVRAGWEPDEVLKVVGLPSMAHTGRLPVTVQSEEAASA